MKDLANEDGITPEDVNDFKKTVLIQKSIDDVKQRAFEQEEIRTSPDRYRKIKSRIKMNMKSQRNSRNGSAMKKTMTTKKGNNPETDGNVNESRLSLNKSAGKVGRSSALGSSTMNQSMYNHIQKCSSNKKTRENPFDITVDEFNRMRNIKLSDQSQLKLTQRDQEIRQSEQDLEVLLKELKS